MELCIGTVAGLYHFCIFNHRAVNICMNIGSWMISGKAATRPKMRQDVPSLACRVEPGDVCKGMSFCTSRFWYVKPVRGWDGIVDG